MAFLNTADMSCHMADDINSQEHDRNQNVSKMEDKVQLKKQINLAYASSIMTGIIIGSGIFVSPVSIIQHCGSIALSLIIWIVAGLVTMGIILSYAELGGIYPKAGGDYAFFMAVMGPFPAFLNTWVLFLAARPAFFAVCALTAGSYLLSPFYSDCEVPEAGVKLISLWILVTLGAVNSTEVKHVARVQVFFTITKLVALGIIVISGFVQLVKGNTEYLARGFEGTTNDLGSVAVAFVSGLFTYGGWNYMFDLLEEVKRPEKVVPRASVISLGTVILLYAFTNVAYFTVMTPIEMAASKAVAVTFAERTLGAFSVSIPIFVSLSATGALNGAILGGARKYFAAARDGMFPDVLATLHVKHGTPIPSIWITCGLAFIYIVIGDAVKLIEYLGFITTFVRGLAMICVIYLKIKQPHLKRPMKVPMVVPVVALLTMILAFILGLYKEPYRNGIGVLLILTGVPFYIIGVLWRRKPKCYINFMTKLTIVVQKLTLVLAEDH